MNPITVESKDVNSSVPSEFSEDVSVSSRLVTNEAKFRLKEFNLKILSALENLDDVKFLDAYINLTNKFSKKIDDCLFIENRQDLDMIISAIKSSESLLKQGIDDGDEETIEVAWDGLYLIITHTYLV
ncbi:MAG: hypothetical protein BZ135_07135 [Methanosphaera sp. rholeuAM6]|nr:MAG: hypothetical protein BZ135_07135 [Methanosphaera sp. rholeuAM6]